MGFIILSVYEQTKSMSRKVPNNVFMQDGIFEKYVINVNKLAYYSDKCLYKNQVELIAR